jgi:hypothetical protein
VFTDNNAFGLSLSGHGSTASDIIAGNAIGIAARPSTGGTVARLYRDQIYGKRSQYLTLLCGR